MMAWLIELRSAAGSGQSYPRLYGLGDICWMEGSGSAGCLRKRAHGLLNRQDTWLNVLEPLLKSRGVYSHRTFPWTLITLADLSRLLRAMDACRRSTSIPPDIYTHTL